MVVGRPSVMELRAVPAKGDGASPLCPERSLLHAKMYRKSLSDTRPAHGTCMEASCTSAFHIGERSSGGREEVECRAHAEGATHTRGFGFRRLGELFRREVGMLLRKRKVARRREIAQSVVGSSQ